jgi:hypothetical protein
MPLSLNGCDALDVMPHANPSLWLASYKPAIINFVNNGG